MKTVISHPDHQLDAAEKIEQLNKIYGSLDAEPDFISTEAAGLEVLRELTKNDAWRGKGRLPEGISTTDAYLDEVRG